MTTPPLYREEPLYPTFGTAINGTGPLGALLTSPPGGDIIDLLSRSGVILFRGFEVNLESFASFVERLAQTGRYPYATQHFSRDKEAKTVSVTKGADAVPFHGEMFYSPRKPDVVCFMCVEAPTNGGETTLLHGTEFLDALSPSTRTAFEKQRVAYGLHQGRDDWHNYFGVTDPEEAIRTIKGWGVTSDVVIDSEGGIRYNHIADAICSSRDGKRRAFINSVLTRLPGVRVSWEDGSPIAPEIKSELTATAQRLSKAVSWQNGDVLAIDNSWVLHGRNAFVGKRDIVARLGVVRPATP
jgi:alpha-ketoglutarate-dependent taurine dioxygenase